MQLTNKDLEIKKIIKFIQKTYQNNKKQTAVMAVSGGIDSALSLTLLSKALGPENITALFLPYGDQDVSDSKLICDFNHLTNYQIINIKNLVDKFLEQLNLDLNKRVRVGNIMARVRMILVYDFAKNHNALVCGTENKSEKYLGYFTRFGDEASDVEPIVHLYKTQVRELARYLKLPEIFLEKSPSAGLWPDQTDEQELGFSYQDADLVLHEFIDNKLNLDQISQKLNLNQKLINKIINRVKLVEFKHQVPYKL